MCNSPRQYFCKTVANINDLYFFQFYTTYQIVLMSDFRQTFMMYLFGDLGVVTDAYFPFTSSNVDLQMGVFYGGSTTFDITDQFQTGENGTSKIDLIFGGQEFNCKYLKKFTNRSQCIVYIQLLKIYAPYIFTLENATYILSQ